MRDKQRIEKFLTLNGWEKDKVSSGDYDSYHKDGNISVDIDSNEVMLICDTGDFYHIKIKPGAYYQVIGFFIDKRFIAIDYKSVGAL